MTPNDADVPHATTIQVPVAAPLRNDRVAARAAGTGQFRWVTVACIGLLNIVLLAVGVWSTLTRFPMKDLGLAGLAVSLAAIGIVTFLAFYNDSADIRTAIAGSFVVVYFAVLTVSLNKQVSEKIDTGGAKMLFDNFTTLVGVIVSFYITGKTIEKVAARAAVDAAASGSRVDATQSA